jgi:predicted component of type VI protein secretion system
MTMMMMMNERRRMIVCADYLDMTAASWALAADSPEAQHSWYDNNLNQRR